MSNKNAFTQKIDQLILNNMDSVKHVMIALNAVFMQEGTYTAYLPDGSYINIEMRMRTIASDYQAETYTEKVQHYIAITPHQRNNANNDAEHFLVHPAHYFNVHDLHSAYNCFAAYFLLSIEEMVLSDVHNHSHALNNLADNEPILIEFARDCGRLDIFKMIIPEDNDAVELEQATIISNDPNWNPVARYPTILHWHFATHRLGSLVEEMYTKQRN